MNTARLLTWIVLGLVGLALVGVLAVWLLKLLIGSLIYILVGAVVVAGGYYLYRRARRALNRGAP